MQQCKYILTDQIGDKYCGNDKSPYCSDWCEIHENCKYKEFEEEAMACKGGKKKGGKKGK